MRAHSAYLDLAAEDWDAVCDLRLPVSLLKKKKGPVQVHEDGHTPLVPSAKALGARICLCQPM